MKIECKDFCSGIDFTNLLWISNLSSSIFLYPLGEEGGTGVHTKASVLSDTEDWECIVEKMWCERTGCWKEVQRNHQEVDTGYDRDCQKIVGLNTCLCFSVPSLFFPTQKIIINIIPIARGLHRLFNRCLLCCQTFKQERG